MCHWGWKMILSPISTFWNLVILWRVDTAHSLVWVLRCVVGSRTVSTGCLMRPSGLA